MKVWIDPPSGWRYGFPKLWDRQGDLFEWLVREGYPQSEIDSSGEYFMVRQWKDEDLNRKLSEGFKEAAEDLGQD